MTIKEIIKITATLLGREDLKKYVDGESFLEDSDTAKAINRLIELANLVINELSLSFVPMVKRERISVAGNKVDYSRLSERAIKIMEVLDSNGNSIDFIAKAEYFVFFGNGETVIYSYLPQKYSYNDQIGYDEKDISLGGLAYGLASEFCLSEGEFELAVLYHDKYIETLEEVCLPKNKICKKRSWL